MEKEAFTKKKKNLIKLISSSLIKQDISNRDKIALKQLLEILNQYSFENRLQKKGLLSHTIIDSLELDYSLGEKFIQFDNDIR